MLHTVFVVLLQSWTRTDSAVIPAGHFIQSEHVHPAAVSSRFDRIEPHDTRWVTQSIYSLVDIDVIFFFLSTCFSSPCSSHLFYIARIQLHIHAHDTEM